VKSFIVSLLGVFLLIQANISLGSDFYSLRDKGRIYDLAYKMAEQKCKQKLSTKCWHFDRCYDRLMGGCLDDELPKYIKTLNKLE